MARRRLDRDGADAIVSGKAGDPAGDDTVPEGYEDVARLLGRLRPRRDSVEADPDVVSRMQGVLEQLDGPDRERAASGSGRGRFGVAVAFAVAGGALLGGLAAANALPGPVVSDALGTIGIAGLTDARPTTPSVDTRSEHPKPRPGDAGEPSTPTMPPPSPPPDVPPGHTPGHGGGGTSDPQPEHGRDSKGHGGGTDPQPDHGNDHGAGGGQQEK